MSTPAGQGLTERARDLTERTWGDGTDWRGSGRNGVGATERTGTTERTRTTERTGTTEGSWGEQKGKGRTFYHTLIYSKTAPDFLMGPSLPCMMHILDVLRITEH